MMQKMLLVAGILSALQTMAQTNEKINGQLKMILKFKGYWQTKATVMQTGGKEYQFAYYADFKTTSDYNGLLMHEWATIPEMGRLD